MPLWLIILIIIAIIIAIYFIFFYSATAAIPSWGINNVTLTISPTQVTCGSGTKFDCKIEASGYAPSTTARNFKVELYDDESFPDKLADYNSSTVGGGGTPGISPRLPSGTTTYVWEKTHNFKLECDSDCHVKGDAGNSDESDPKVYAIFTVMHGTPKPTKESTRVQIKCVSAS